MLNVGQIDEWLGQEVLDSEGESIGKLEDVYYDRERGEPQLALVKHGLLGRKQTLVPLEGATVGRDHLRLAYASAQIEQVSETIDPQAGETITATDAQGLAQGYGLQLEAQELDSANAVDQRRLAAREAEERAAALEIEARERAQDAQQAQVSAREEETEAAEAQRAAEQARTEADRLSRGT